MQRKDTDETRRSRNGSTTRDETVKGRFKRGRTAQTVIAEAPSGDGLDGDLSHITLSTPAGELQMLLDRLDDAEDHSTAFQSFIVATTRALNDVLTSEYEAAEAAISLAQREKLEAMVEELRKVARILNEALDEKGRQLRDCSGKPAARLNEFHPSENSESAWWFGLSEAIETVRRSAEQLESMIQSHHRDSAARQLARVVVRLLQRHRRQLLFEAERWMAS